MRNLKLQVTSSWTPDPALFSPSATTSTLSVMEEMDEKYVFLSRGDVVVRLSPASGAILSLQLGQEVLLGEGERVVTVQPVFDQLFIVTSHRAFVCTADLHDLECVREFPVAVVTAVWSPNLDLVAIVTEDDRLSLASGSDLFERGDFDLRPDHFGRAKLVDVGWGKKETQFHGSEGKAAALKKVQPTVGISPFDAGRVGLSWQSDSELFAVTSVDEEASRRVLRLWTADGELHATGEVVPVSSAAPEGPAMAWRGSGNRVALAARKSQPQAPPEVVFYERNGLQHRQLGGSFTVDVDEEGSWRIGMLAWNAAVDILAVGLERSEAKGETCCAKVQVWTSGNRHWYRKYELDLMGDGAVAMLWDPTEAGRLHVLTQSGAYRAVEWAWSVSRAEGAEQPSCVAVIDGRRLRVSPFRGMCVPPPMAAFSVRLPAAAVLQLAFCPRGRGMVAHLADGGLLLLRLSDHADGSLMPGVELEPSCCPSTLHLSTVQRLLPSGALTDSHAHLTWTGEAAVVMAHPRGLTAVTWTGLEDVQRSEVALPDVAEVAGVTWSDGRLFVQDSAGTVWRREGEGWVLQTRLSGRCDQWNVIRLRSGEDLCLGLQSQFNRLMGNDVVLMTDCTSYIVHDSGDFLLTTTTSNRLQCLPLRRCATPQDIIKELKQMTPAISQTPNQNVHNELVRAVERGSLIVTSVGEEAKVVLQMPRGNLETIFPRALVLDTVRRFLDKGEVRAAYSLMRRHRVNMNLLFDHNLRRFLADPQMFVEAMGHPDDINQVLSELCEEDLSETLYKEHYRLQDREKGVGGGKKVNLVCDAFEAVLAGGEDRFLPCLVTCKAKRRPQMLEEALDLVVRRQRSGECGQGDVDLALRTLTYYVSTLELYKLALGTYDFDAVMFVLDNSSLDPREHLPFLEELKSFPEDYRCFRIDVYNEKLAKAISHVLPSRDAAHFEEALSLVRQHNLFAAALALYPLDQTHSDEYKTISRAFAERLRLQQSGSGLDAAGRVLLRCGEAREAARCFLGAVNWRKWAVAVQMAGMEEEEVRGDARSLAGSLESRGDFEAAAQVLTKFAGDCDAAVATAAEGGCWDLAVSLAHENGRTELLEVVIRPQLVSATEDADERMKAVHREVEERADRLAAVRDEFTRRALEELQRPNWEDETMGGGVGSDLYSETTSIAESSASSSASVGSRSSTGSSRTGKSRRKAERKRWTLKEGSEYEEVALMERLYQLAEQSNRLKGEVTTLSATLVDFSLSEDAFRLTRQCANLLGLIRRRRDEIWWETAKKKEGEFENLSAAASLLLLRGEASATRRRYPDIHEVFLRFPPQLETPPTPSPLMYCPQD